jgi:hypothetical protein
MQALTWYFFRETSINLLTMQGTSHFFQEGNWTETPEDHILQVLIIAWASFQIITICILIFFSLSGMVSVKGSSIKFCCMNLTPLER